MKRDFLTDEQIEKEIERINSVNIPPSKEINEYLEKNGSQTLSTGIKLAELIRRPELDYEKLTPVDTNRPDLPTDIWQEAEILIKYDGYIKRQISSVKQPEKEPEKPPVQSTKEKEQTEAEGYAFKTDHNLGHGV